MARNLVEQRSIPAGAGEPTRPGNEALAHRVHPRGCGGAETESRKRKVTTGPSPRVRGSQVRTAQVRTAQGSIPAGAGEPCLWISAAAA